MTIQCERCKQPFPSVPYRVNRETLSSQEGAPARKHHYVACSYLKRFAVSPGRVLTYRLLAMHPRCPLWQERAIKGVGYHAHLYTRMVAGVESDEIEKWLSAEFETPAEDALRKATYGEKLSTHDWHNLIRFAAAQDVRTPARLSENLEHWKEAMPKMLDAVVKDAADRLEGSKVSADEVSTSSRAVPFPNSEYIPLSLTKEIDQDQKSYRLRANVIVGRGLWLFSLRHALTSTLNTLLGHRWSILRAADGLKWFTSDDPVVRVNYYGNDKYDLRGGWGNRGTEILLPLDPHHLLYTKIGERPPDRGTVLSVKATQIMRGVIAEHAHRYIFAAAIDDEIPILRPRLVDAALIRREREQWNKWNEDQLAAERELSNP